MAQGFELGDKVEALDDVTRGRVVAIDGSQITVESSDGFLLHYHDSELLNISGQQRLSVSPLEVAKAKAQEEPAAPRKTPVKKKERNAPRMEVDLHVGQLLPSTRGMSKYDILNLQLETAKRQLEFAMEKRIQRVVFIHGVGEGILKEELGYLFGRYDNLTYYDADYQKYGLGATEVYIYQKK